MKRTLILITLLCTILLSSCIAKVEVNESIIPKDEPKTESISSQDSSLESETSENSSEAEVINTDYFKIITDTAAYEFHPETKVGSYYIQFQDVNSITVTLQDGRTMQLIYDEIVFDEETQTHRTKINELDFLISEFHDSDNNLVQVFECVEPLENIGDFNGRVESTITVNYKPELENGEINMSFLYEVDGDTLTITYPDGRNVTKTIKYNEDGKTFLFAE